MKIFTIVLVILAFLNTSHSEESRGLRLKDNQTAMTVGSFSLAVDSTDQVTLYSPQDLVKAAPIIASTCQGSGRAGVQNLLELALLHGANVRIAIGVPKGGSYCISGARLNSTK